MRGTLRARLLLGCVAIWLLGSLDPGRAEAAVLRVPLDHPTLQAAIAAVAADGDVIELAAGIYPSPVAAPDGNAGFLISNRPFAFTIRAAEGATVVLDGEGQRPVLRFINTSLDAGRLVTFERLEFRNGRSSTLGLTAGVTLQRGQAVFRDCLFDGNHTLEPSSGGGGTAVSVGSQALFERTTWSNNSSVIFGGGLAVQEHSTVTIRDSRFLFNSVALAGHAPTAAGGGLHVGNSHVVVERTRFESNAAGYVGGGLYAIGTWGDAQGGATVEVTNSLFLGNDAVRHPSVAFDSPTEGGGAHAEDLALLRIEHCRFLGNEAQHGGGLNAYRAQVEVVQSEFRGNAAVGGSAFLGVGGQINVISNDGVDSTTGMGALNRRTVELLVEDSLLRGEVGDQTRESVGGCLYAGGDTYRAFGLLGTPQQGSIAQNRAPVTLRRVLFDDCDVQQNDLGGSGTGGALTIDLVDLRLEDSILLDGDAFGTLPVDAGSGGGAAVLSHSRAEAVRTTFAGNTASRYGAALFAQGAELAVADSAFLENEISPGVAEECFLSYGAAVFTAPAAPFVGRPGSAATGTVSTSLVSENVGVPIFDDDRDLVGVPVNETRYDGNQVHAPDSAGAVFSNAIPNNVPPFSFCLTAAQMSALVVQRPNTGTSSPKALVPSIDLAARVPFAALVAAPSTLVADAAAGEPAPSGLTSVAFAWSGTGATLDGAPLVSTRGVVELAAGTHRLIVDGGLATAEVVVVPEPSGPLVAAGVALAMFAARGRKPGR